MCGTKMYQSTVQKGLKKIILWLLIQVERKLNLIKNHSTDFWNTAQEAKDHGGDQTDQLHVFAQQPIS